MGVTYPKLGGRDIDVKTVLMAVQFIISLALIVAVLLQTNKDEGLGALGGAQMFFDKQSRSEATLERATEILAGLFLLSTLILLAI